MLQQKISRGFLAKIILFVTILFSIGLVSGVAMYLLKTPVENPAPVIIPAENEIAVKMDKAEYEQGEAVGFSIKNNTAYPIIIQWPYRVRMNGSAGWVNYCEYPVVGNDGLEREKQLSGGEVFLEKWDQEKVLCDDETLLSAGGGKADIGNYEIVVLKRKSGKMSDSFDQYFSKFIIKEKIATDPRCSQKVKGTGACKMIKSGYEFDAIENKCVQKTAVNGCTFIIPFDSSEECQKICVTKIISGNELEFETIIKGVSSSQAERKDYVIKSQSEWMPILQKAAAELPAPIDFTRDMAVAVFQGVKNTGGYRIEISKIIEKENAIEISVRDISPGRGCMVTQATTNPYHVVKVSRSDKEVIFKTEKTVNNCK